MKKNVSAIVAGVIAGIALVCASSAHGIQPVQEPPVQEAVAAKEPTTIIIVRHAEKWTDDPRDPSLSEVGQARAKALAAALEGAQVSAIYATEYKRTQETGKPLAEQPERMKQPRVAVTVRPVAGTTVQAYVHSLAREILEKQSGKTVVIIGHSNTVPELVRAFGGKEVTPLTEEEYDRLYILVRPATGPLRLFQTRYGLPGIPRP